MYSCGSLAPKLKRGGGCMHSDYRKPTEPWEVADGYGGVMYCEMYIPLIQ